MTVSECNTPVAENIERIISEKGLKKTFVAQKAGYTAQMFNDMIKGRKIIKVSDIFRLCSVLGVDANYLYGIKKGE